MTISTSFRPLGRRGLLASTAAFAAALAGAAWLAGCDQQRASQLESGVSTEDDVRRLYGQPKNVVQRPDGSKILEYPRQPEGSTNLRITIGSDGKLVVIRQQLTRENFDSIRPGMARAEVRDLLGEPFRTRRFPLKPDEEHWDWRFQEPGGHRKVFSVTFDREGRVTASQIGDDERDTQIGG